MGGRKCARPIAPKVVIDDVSGLDHGPGETWVMVGGVVGVGLALYFACLRWILSLIWRS